MGIMKQMFVDAGYENLSEREISLAEKARHEKLKPLDPMWVEINKDLHEKSEFFRRHEQGE